MPAMLNSTGVEPATSRRSFLDMPVVVGDHVVECSHRAVSVAEGQQTLADGQWSKGAGALEDHRSAGGEIARTAVAEPTALAVRVHPLDGAELPDARADPAAI